MQTRNQAIYEDQHVRDEIPGIYDLFSLRGQADRKNLQDGLFAGSLLMKLRNEIGQGDVKEAARSHGNDEGFDLGGLPNKKVRKHTAQNRGESR